MEDAKSHQVVASSSTSPDEDDKIKVKKEPVPKGSGSCQGDEVISASEGDSADPTQSEPDSTHTDSNKDMICVVCGDKANGMHYRALTCEGCKTFFRRNARRRDGLKCDMEDQGKCEMDLYMRRHCAYCRMKKCLEVGMQVGRLWDKERLKTRKPIKKIKPTQEVPDEDVDDQETLLSSLPSKPELSEEHKQLIAIVSAAYKNSTEKSQDMPERPTQTIEEARNQRKLPGSGQSEESDVTQAILASMSSINEDVAIPQQSSQQPSVESGSDVTMAAAPAAGEISMQTILEDIPSCSQQNPGRLPAAVAAAGRESTQGVSGTPNEGTSANPSVRKSTSQDNEEHDGAGGQGDELFTEAVYKHIMETSLLVLRQMIAFAKELPGFQHLQCEDQAALVKGTFVEYLVLTSGGLFDAEKGTFTSLVNPGATYTASDGYMAGFAGMMGQVLQFSEKMAKLKLSADEQAVLYAICVLTPDRPELSESAKNIISSYQEPLVNALCASGRVNHSDHPQFFPKVVMLLTELRNCTESFMDHMMQLKLKGQFIQPLLGEVFEM